MVYGKTMTDMVRNEGLSKYIADHPAHGDMNIKIQSELQW